LWDFIENFVRHPIARHHRRGTRIPTVLSVIDTADKSRIGCATTKGRRQRSKDEKNEVWEHCEPPFSRQAATQRVLV